MADRVQISIAKRSSLGGLALAWLKPLENYITLNSQPQATSIMATIKRPMPVDQMPAFLMYSGHFNWANESHQATAFNIFQTKASEAWRSELCNLGWMKFLAASNRQLHQYFALQILQSWSKAKLTKPIWSDIVFNLAVDGAVLFKNCEDKAALKFLGIVTNSVNKLVSTTSKTPLETLEKSISLLCATVAFRGLHHYRKTAIDLFDLSIIELINADGGPKSRNLAEVVNLLGKLLPLRRAFKEQHQSLPQTAHDAIARMLQFLSMVRHGDGNLFRHDGPRFTIDLINSIQSYEDIPEHQPRIAPQTGFARIVQQKSCLIIDSKSNLKTEFSYGIQDIFRSDTVSTAHSVKMEHQFVPQGEILQIALAGHHRRSIFLSKDGNDLRIEDQSDGPHETFIKFNPSLKVTTIHDCAGLMLVTPENVVWLLSLRGGKLILEDGGKDFRLVSPSGKLNWAFKRQVNATKSQLLKKQILPDLLS